MNPVLLRALFVAAVASCLEMSDGMPYSDRAFADRMTTFAYGKASMVLPQPRTRSLPDIPPTINTHLASLSPTKLNNGKGSFSSLPNKVTGNRRVNLNVDFVSTESPDEVRVVSFDVKALPGIVFSLAGLVIAFSYWIKDPLALLNDTFGTDEFDYRTEVYQIDDLLTSQP